MRTLALIVVIGVFVGMIACGPSAQDAAFSCGDMADAVAEAGKRCNQGTYDENYNSFVKGAACGDCANIVSVRDKEALGRCVAQFRTVACDKMIELANSSDCQGQLQRRSDLVTCP